MQCFMKRDKGLIESDVENVEITLIGQLCFLSNSCLLFVTVLSHPSQSCFSRILCNLFHLPLWCVHCFILSALSVSTSFLLLCAD